MKPLTSLLTNLKSRSRRGNEADDSGRANHGVRLLTSAATGRALTKLTLAAVLLTTAVAARADWVSGYTRSNGTYVAPHYRTPANGSVYDNLSHRGYPSQQPGYVSPRSYGYESDWSRPIPLPNWNDHSRSQSECFTPSPYDFQPKRDYRPSSLAGFDY